VNALLFLSFVYFIYYFVFDTPHFFSLFLSLHFFCFLLSLHKETVLLNLPGVSCKVKYIHLTDLFTGTFYLLIHGGIKYTDVPT